MKLIYLWVENYQCIKEQGYLLNAGYDVKYNKEKKDLSISKKDSIDSMLYGDKISVTAIVGDNGAGKSTLLDVIRIVLFDNDRREKEITGFLVWEDAGKQKLFLFMKDNNHLEIKGTVEVNKYLTDDFSLIYYSDSLDEKYYLEEFDDGKNQDESGFSFQNRCFVQLNISTPYLLRKSGSSVLDYFHSDTKRQINYYGSLREMAQKLPFPAPTSLSARIEFLDIDIFDRVLDSPLQAYEYRGMGHHGEINTHAYVIGLLKKMERIYEKKTIWNPEPLESIQILQWNIFTTYIYDLLAMRKQWNEEPYNDYGYVDEIINNVISVEVDELEKNFWNELERIFSEKSTNEESFENYLKFYHKVNWMLKSPKNGDFRVDFYIPDNMMQILKENNSSLHDSRIVEKSIHCIEDFLNEFPKEYMNKNGWNGNWDRKSFIDLYDSYMEISHEIDFLKCSWGMSSGENSMFNLFARLHEAMQKQKKKNVILIFDELDSSFHPQWQQKIIDSLTGFLRVSYPQNEFQVILTTHSPVLLSDIPRGNVVFMRKENVVEAEHAQTFAANIASLYYDSFFMEKGSIGEVARRSIVNLMKAISELEEDWQKESPEIGEYQKRIPETDIGIELFNRFLQKQYRGTEECKLNNRITKSGENALKLLQLLIDNIGEDIWRYKANERLRHLLKDNKADREGKIRTQLNELEKTEGRKFVREFVKQWLKEEN